MIGAGQISRNWTIFFRGGGIVEALRRVFAIPYTDIVSMEPDQTAESYTTELGWRYGFIVILSGGYLLLYAAAWGVILVRKR